MSAGWQGAAIEYPFPARPGRNRLDWELDPAGCLLLVHDMQHYFLGRFRAGTEPRTTLETNVSALVAGARAAGVPVVYTAQPGSMSADDRGLLKDLWGDGMRARPEHTGIPESYGPRGDDLVLTKWRYSAFGRTSLAEYLSRSSRRQIVVCGVYAHVGILATVLDAYSADIQPFVVHDGVAAFDHETHAMATTYLRDVAAVVLDTEGVVRAFESTPR